MVDKLLRRKARGLSKRGLLELDIFLSRFIESLVFSKLTDEELSIYIQILNWQDYDLLQVLQRTKPINNINEVNVIKKIQSCSIIKKD